MYGNLVSVYALIFSVTEAWEWEKKTQTITVVFVIISIECEIA